MKKKLEQLNLNFDDPTVEETEMHQRMAGEIELNDRCEYYLNEERIKRYTSFLRDVENLRISFKKFEDIDSKRKLLNKYFPDKYNSQRLEEYSDPRFNEVFLGFVNYACTVVRKSHNK